MDTADDAGNRLDVDARFLLANERTLLAWVRTSLTLVAGGVAVQQLGNRGGRTLLALVLLVGGLLTAVAGAARHRAADTALRAGRLPATGNAPYVVAGLAAVLAVLATVVVLASA